MVALDNWGEFLLALLEGVAYSDLDGKYHKCGPFDAVHQGLPADAQVIELEEDGFEHPGEVVDSTGGLLSGILQVREVLGELLLSQVLCGGDSAKGAGDLGALGALMSTAEWAVMWERPVILAPWAGLEVPHFRRRCVRPVISSDLTVLLLPFCLPSPSTKTFARSLLAD